MKSMSPAPDAAEAVDVTASETDPNKAVMRMPDNAHRAGDPTGKSYPRLVECVTLKGNDRPRRDGTCQATRAERSI